MPFGSAILATSFVFLLLLLPPILLVVSVFRYFTRRRSVTGFIRLLISTPLAFIPFALNLTYAIGERPNIAAGNFEFDEWFMGALFLSWLTIWLNVALRRARRKRTVLY